jgi:hypothetical protein
MAEQEWEKFKIGDPAFYRGREECQQIVFVRHIAHIKEAIRILEDNIIRSSLIWDESRLNNSRTCVSWVSPNSWVLGSIYGNVSFEFDWNRISENKRFYWVEGMYDYRPPAYRILVTDQNYDSWELLQRFEPTIPDGPIFFDGEVWYRNGNFTGELMIDSDLSLRKCAAIKFVDHHPNICSKNSCSEMGMHKTDSGSIVLSNIIGRDMTYARRFFIKQNGEGAEIDFEIQPIISYLRGLFEDGLPDAFVPYPNADTIIKAALVLYGNGNKKECWQLLDIVNSKQQIRLSFNNIIFNYFGLEIT